MTKTAHKANKATTQTAREAAAAIDERAGVKPEPTLDELLGLAKPTTGGRGGRASCALVMSQPLVVTEHFVPTLTNENGKWAWLPRQAQLIARMYVHQVKLNGWSLTDNQVTHQVLDDMVQPFVLSEPGMITASTCVDPAGAKVWWSWGNLTRGYVQGYVDVMAKPYLARFLGIEGWNTKRKDGEKAQSDESRLALFTLGDPLIED
jgi:hypothetical protein